MQVTEVRVQLVQNQKNQERLRGFATITLENAFVVRDIKIIHGDQSYFLAMPSRKASEHCPECGAKNTVAANYCNMCGKKLPESVLTGRKAYVDIAHPINAECRNIIHDAIMAAFKAECEQQNIPLES